MPYVWESLTYYFPVDCQLKVLSMSNKAYRGSCIGEEIVTHSSPCSIVVDLKPAVGLRLPVHQSQGWSSKTENNHVIKNKMPVKKYVFLVSWIGELWSNAMLINFIEMEILTC